MAQEILDRADTDAERMVKLSSIRTELTKGRWHGRYETEDGRWSLAASPPADSEGVSDMLAAPERGGTAGVSSDAAPSEAGPSREQDAAAGSKVGDGSDEDALSPDPEAGRGQSRLVMNW